MIEHFIHLCVQFFCFRHIFMLCLILMSVFNERSCDNDFFSRLTSTLWWWFFVVVWWINLQSIARYKSYLQLLCLSYLYLYILYYVCICICWYNCASSKWLSCFYKYTNMPERHHAQQKRTMAWHVYIIRILMLIMGISLIVSSFIINVSSLLVGQWYVSAKYNLRHFLLFSVK